MQVPNQVGGFDDIVRRRAIESPDAIAFIFEDHRGSRESRTYAELHQRATAIAYQLTEETQSGDRALLLFPPSADFVDAFIGCLYAGVIAVPCPYPRPNEDSDYLLRLHSDCTPTVALTNQPAELRPRALREVDSLCECVFLTPALERIGSCQEEGVYRREKIAFLQYTSGSTSNPKGVLVSHKNLLDNSEQIKMAYHHSASTKGVIWLPPFHDMGLVGGILQPLYTGFAVTLLSPVSFLRNPFRWLSLITEDSANTSGGPNFAYQHCVDRIDDSQVDELDLSSWSVAFVGGEPVREATLRAFATKFKGAGFDPRALTVSYGLAEATLYVSSTPFKVGPAFSRFSSDSPTVASCGRPVGTGCNIQIVHPDTGELVPEGSIGEIWVASGSVAEGYWKSPEASARCFNVETAAGCQRRYLRTGDLGFLQSGALYLTGRLKDLLIVKGRNIHPEAVEGMTEVAHRAIPPSGAAVFSIANESGEQVIVLAEVKRPWRKPDQIESIVARIREVVVRTFQMRPVEVHLVRSGELPRTTSGKVRRSRARTKFLDGDFQLLGDADEPSKL